MIDFKIRPSCVFIHSFTYFFFHSFFFFQWIRTYLATQVLSHMLWYIEKQVKSLVPMEFVFVGGDRFFFFLRKISVLLSAIKNTRFYLSLGCQGRWISGDWWLAWNLKHQSRTSLKKLMLGAGVPIFQFSCLASTIFNWPDRNRAEIESGPLCLCNELNSFP